MPASWRAWLVQRGRAWMLLLAVAAGVGILVALSGPPRKLVIATGPAGSYFERTARTYAAQLKAEGVEAELVASEGALDNLKRINAPGSGIDIAFALGGMTDSASSPDLVSLGSIAYEPVWIFYRRSLGTLTSIGELKGKRLILGPSGSGANFLSRRLLRIAGLAEPNVTLVEADVATARRMLASGEADAGFFMDPPETPYIHDLFMQRDVAVMNLVDAEALRRHLPFLHVIDVPRSTIDIAGGQPAESIQVVATTAVVVARKRTHAALIYLLMSIIDTVHEPPTLLQRENDFPADKDVDLVLSPQAENYFREGKPFLQRYLPFWLASLVERLLKILVPLLAVLVPLTNYLPRALQWRMQRKAARCYQLLMQLERRVDSESREDLQAEFDDLSARVDRHLHENSISASDAYILKEHIELVRGKLRDGAP